MGKNNINSNKKDIDCENKATDIKDVRVFFEKQLERTNTWLDFAEAKSAGLIVANIALIGVVENFFLYAPVFTVITVALALLSSLCCLLTFLPNLENSSKSGTDKINNNPNLIYFGDISKFETADYYVSLVANSYFGNESSLEKDGYIHDLATEIIINSQITMKKYDLFYKALRIDWIAFVMIVATFIAA